MATAAIPSWQLYGEVNAFPDILHVEQVVDRAAGLNWSIRPHRHFHLHQLFLLTSGNVTLTLDGESFSVAPPVVINIPRGTVHGFSFSSGTEGVVVTLPADNFPDLFAAPAETASALERAFIVIADLASRQRIQALASAYVGSAAFRRTLLRAEAAALIAQVTEKAQKIESKHVSYDPRIQLLEGMVRAGLTGRLSLEDLARRLAMSPRNLSRLCRAKTGMSPRTYIEAQKMREACRLLVYTRMSNQQIAYQLAFDDPSYFSRVFRRNLHISPSTYRSRFERKGGVSVSRDQA